MKRMVYGMFAVAIALVMVQRVSAHFKLLAPQGWIVEDERLGDPQKAAPCGGTLTDQGKPSNIVTKVQGGQKLHLKVMETVFHAGYYRVALAVNSRAELPADPMVMTKDSARGPQSVAAMIQYPPQVPILADGLFQHTVKSADAFETDVEIPNISCPKCTMQIIEFMADHGLNNPGDYSYHHCADLQITADPAKPVDARWPKAR